MVVCTSSLMGVRKIRDFFSRLESALNTFYRRIGGGTVGAACVFERRRRGGWRSFFRLDEGKQLLLVGVHVLCQVALVS